MNDNLLYLVAGILAANHVLAFVAVWFLTRAAERRDQRRAHEIAALCEKLMALSRPDSLAKHARYREIRSAQDADRAKPKVDKAHYVDPDIVSTQRHLKP